MKRKKAWQVGKRLNPDDPMHKDFKGKKPIQKRETKKEEVTDNG